MHLRLAAVTTIAVWMAVGASVANARHERPMQSKGPSVVEQAIQLKNHTNAILASKCQSTYTRNLAGVSLSVWQKRHLAAHRVKRVCPARPPHYRQWRCIHHFEGAWNDPNPPYWGGLQMDLSFQRANGWRLLRAKGTADHWTPLEQMWAAEHAFAANVRHGENGFSSWPNTARYCGLL